MLSDISRIPFLARLGAGVLVLGTLMAFWSPYGTGYMGWPGVWLYWTGLMALGWSVGLGMEAWLERHSPPLKRVWLYGAVTLAVSLALSAATLVFHAVRGLKLTAQLLLDVALEVTVLTAVIVAIYAVLRHRGAGAGAAAETRADAALLDRMPPKHQRARILAIMAEDHYLRVHTEAGDCLIRMRLADAVKAVATLDGAQVHRSWWVAREAVDLVERKSGRVELVLSNGVRAPVSRSQGAHLREAGWF